MPIEPTGPRIDAESGDAVLVAANTEADLGPVYLTVHDGDADATATASLTAEEAEAAAEQLRAAASAARRRHT